VLHFRGSGSVVLITPERTTPHDHGELGWMMMMMKLQRPGHRICEWLGHKVTWLIAGKLLKNT